jgi:hypothetical protein
VGVIVSYLDKEGVVANGSDSSYLDKVGVVASG